MSSFDEELFKKWKQEQDQKADMERRLDELKATAEARAKSKGYNTSGVKARRDVHLHTAVTITRFVNGSAVLGEEDNEICQYAAAFPAPMKTPTPVTYVERAFDEMKVACIQKMRECGLILE